MFSPFLFLKTRNYLDYMTRESRGKRLRANGKKLIIVVKVFYCTAKLSKIQKVKVFLLHLQPQIFRSNSCCRCRICSWAALASYFFLKHRNFSKIMRALTELVTTTIATPVIVEINHAKK